MSTFQNIINSPIFHTIFFGTFYYVYLIIIVRITGKRSLAEMNAFDMIVNIAIGSILSQLIIDETIPLIEGLVLISILIILQYIITFVSTRIEGLNKIIKSQPTLIYYKDHFIEENLKKERMTKSEIEKGIRNSGNGSFEEISAVILESDGSLSVIKNVNENNELEKYKKIYKTKITSTNFYCGGYFYDLYLLSKNLGSFSI